jgi:hypothetical protein
LRTEVLKGQSRPEGLGAVVYHGMWRGLGILLAAAVKRPTPLAQKPPSARQPLPKKHQLVHLLANMLLRTQSEVMHVY